MPPAIARTATREPATMACRLTLSRLAWRSRSRRSFSRAADLAAWLFRLLIVVISMGDAHMPYAGYVGGTAGAQRLWLRRISPPRRMLSLRRTWSRESDRARRSSPSQGMHEQAGAGGGPPARRGPAPPGPRP